MTLWSNPGEIVFTPFMGVGSEVFGSVRLGRKGVGVELKPSYFQQAIRNMRAVDLPVAEQPDLGLVDDAALSDVMEAAD